MQDEVDVNRYEMFVAPLYRPLIYSDGIAQNTPVYGSTMSVDIPYIITSYSIQFEQTCFCLPRLLFSDWYTRDTIA
jgi:hypothetical protein